MSATSAAIAAIAFTKEYVQQRTAFGQPVASFQNTKFVLAECATEVEAAQIMVDRRPDACRRGQNQAVLYRGRRPRHR